MYDVMSLGKNDEWATPEFENVASSFVTTNCGRWKKEILTNNILCNDHAV